LSEAFGDFWHDLANDLGFEPCFLDDGEGLVPRDAAAVILAAGGVESDALFWLDSCDVKAVPPILVVGADPKRRTAVQIVSAGASDYLALPDEVELLRNAVAEHVERHSSKVEKDEEASQVDSEAFGEIVGESAALKEVLWLAARLLPHRDATAVILGETGTGKELMARALHYGGPRREAPFVPVNCSALPDNLVESELFGHERGAFTDAHAAKPGLFEIADGGTLFLDEIGDLPLELQAKLLRALDDRTIRRVGGTTERKVDVRIVAATNENLAQAVEEGRFRQDLYFRLSVIVLTLPPLRDRGDDVTLLAEALLEKAAKQHGLPVPTISTEAKSILKGHHWPGNVRELKNAVERGLLVSPPGEFHMDAHPSMPAPRLATSSDSVIPFPAPLSEIAKAAAHATLEQCGGNRSEAARRLGVSRRKLRALLEEIELVEERSA
jgi:two-component system response regulator HydG